MNKISQLPGKIRAIQSYYRQDNRRMSRIMQISETTYVSYIAHPEQIRLKSLLLLSNEFGIPMSVLVDDKQPLTLIMT